MKGEAPATSGASLLTVASVAIISSLGLTYILDQRRDRQDKYLRELLSKDVVDTINQSKEQLNSL